MMLNNKMVKFYRQQARKEHHRLLEYSANQFFQPIEQAKKKYFATNTACMYSLMMTTGSVGVAFGAAALSIDPSTKYAKTEHYNPILFQLSGVLSALMINLYGINCLLGEWQKGKSVRFIMVVSMILGIVSTLPIFFIQQLESNDERMSEMIIAIAITIGSMPLQILGFLEFCHMIYPQLAYFYRRQRYSQDPIMQIEWEERGVFLKKLELGLEYCILTNQMPEPCDITSDTEFVNMVLKHGEACLVGLKEASVCEKGVLLMGGAVGIILAEIVNLAFVKATFDSFSPKMNVILAGVLTGCVTFPAAVLSAEFGFNAVYALLQPVFNVLQTCHGNELFRADAHPISPGLKAMRTLFCLMLSSCSFAASVQFNRDLFKNQLSSHQMAILNDLTLLGVLLFNNYVLNHVSSQYLMDGLARWSDTETQNKVKRYQFAQVVLTEYKQMNASLISDGVNHKLPSSVEAISSVETDSNVGLNFSPSV